MDVDKSGTLDEGEVELLCATAGKRLTKRQLHDAMVSMDEDGSVRSFPTFSNVSTFMLLLTVCGAFAFACTCVCVCVCVFRALG